MIFLSIINKSGPTLYHPGRNYFLDSNGNVELVQIWKFKNIEIWKFENNDIGD